MKSNLTEKLLSICGNSMEGFSINDSTEEQRVQVEAELIKHFEFDKIVWMELPSGLTEDKTTPIVAKTYKITNDDPKHTGKIGYVYKVLFSPKIYEPKELHEPVKDGCVFAPIIYNPETFEPKQSITISWSPDFPQDIDAPVRTYEDDKQMIRDMLEKVLENPEEYRPKGHIACLVRFATI
jgi:hypothetical protein